MVDNSFFASYRSDGRVWTGSFAKKLYSIDVGEMKRLENYEF